MSDDGDTIRYTVELHGDIHDHSAFREIVEEQGGEIVNEEDASHVGGRRRRPIGRRTRFLLVPPTFKGRSRSAVLTAVRHPYLKIGDTPQGLPEYGV